MAIVRAIASGNWSNTAIWNTGALPTSSDDVYSNTFTVTIDISPTVLSISNAATTGVTAGGSFVPNNGITLTCTTTGTIRGLNTSTLTSGQSCNIVANFYASADTTALTHSSVGTLNIIGNVTGSSSSFGSAFGIVNSAGGTVNITGNVTGGGQNGTGIVNSAGGTVNITGNVTGGSVSLNTSFGVSNGSVGTIVITGNVTAGTATGAHGINNASTGSVTIIGTIAATTVALGVVSPSISAIVILSGPFLTSSNGVNPVYCTRWFWQNSNVTPTYYQVRTANLATIRPLYTADSVGGNPAIANVRSGTVYGPNNELTGTCAVPPAGSVALGVPVDNTTGTAAITEASIRSALGLASANLDTQLNALPTAVENASAVRTELATELNRIDTDISTRSTFDPTVDVVAHVTLVDITTDLTNPPVVPTPEQIALAVANELDPTLTEIDDNVLTRLAAEDYVEPPTAEQNAAAVRVELSPELARVENCATVDTTGQQIQNALSS